MFNLLINHWKYVHFICLAMLSYSSHIHIIQLVKISLLLYIILRRLYVSQYAGIVMWFIGSNQTLLSCDFCSVMFISLSVRTTFNLITAEFLAIEPHPLTARSSFIWFKITLTTTSRGNQIMFSHQCDLIEVMEFLPAMIFQCSYRYLHKLFCLHLSIWTFFNTSFYSRSHLRE